MRSPVLDAQLREYDIGDKVRRLRLRKKLGLVELGRHTGLSAAMLSKVERGRLFPTLPTLLRIAMVFGVGLEYFFDRRRTSVAIVRRADRLRLPERNDGRPVAYEFECLDFAAVDRKMNAYLATFEPIGADVADPHEHAGAEFLYVTQGELTLSVEGVEHTLCAGDSAYFDPSLPHSYRSASHDKAEAVVVTVG